jgi:hypothetical protein
MSDIDPSVCHVVAQQHALGWHHMFEGIVAKHWRQQQSFVFDRGKKRKSNKKWLVGLMHRLLNLGRNQWLHQNSTKHVTKRPWHQRAKRLLS